LPYTAKRGKMDEILLTRKHFPLMVVRAAWPWRFAGKLVYSFLSYRAMKNTGAGQREIASETGLNRRTVAARLVEMTEAGLVRRANSRWFAVEPPEPVAGYFIKSPHPAKHWSLGLQSYPIFMPSDRLSLRAAAIFSLLWDLGRKKKGVVRGTSHSHLAILLGISPNTARTALNELAAAGLVRIFPGGPIRLAVMLAGIGEQHEVYFAARPEREPADFPGLDDALAAQEEPAPATSEGDEGQDQARRELANPPASEQTPAKSKDQPREYRSEDVRWLYTMLTQDVPIRLANEIMDLFFPIYEDGKMSVKDFLLLIDKKRQYADTGSTCGHPGFLLRSHFRKMLGMPEDQKPRRKSIFAPE